MSSIVEHAEKSPLKNYTLMYDHERQKQLEELEQKSVRPHGFARDQTKQIEKSKKIASDTYITNKE